MDPITALARRTPVTTALLLTCVLASLASAALGAHHAVEFGLPSALAGRWWTFAVGAFVTPTLMFLPLLLTLVGLVSGALERRVGSRRTAVVLVTTHLAGTVGAAGVLLVGHALPWPWADRLASLGDTGPSAAGFGALAVLAGTLRPAHRRLLVSAGSAYLLVMVLCSGLLWDLEHLLAFGGGLLLARVPGPILRRAPGSPLERIRVSTALLVVMAGVAGLVQTWFPGYGGALGSGDQHDAGPLLTAVVVLLGTLVVGDGLRRGSRWAWRVAPTGAALGLVGWLFGMPWSAGTVACLAAVVGLGVAHHRATRRDDARHGPGDLQAALVRHGGGSLGWQHTWADHESWTSTSGVTLGFRRSVGVAIVLADPIGPRFAWHGACREFVQHCRHQGLVVAWYAVSRELLRETGLEEHAVRVGEDAIVDLPGLALTGRAWQDARTARNRAAREQISMQRLDVREPALVGQVAAISDAWTEAKPLPEMGFTLGGLREALDPAVRVHVALDAAGTVLGVVSWLPVHRDGEVVGWTLDLMRRPESGFRPVMEFLIAESLLVFRDEGYLTASLSVAPLARSGEPDGVLERLLDRCGRALEPAYGFSSLHAFKRKFSPGFRPVYLAYESTLDLPRIALAIGHAHLPAIGLRDAARVVRVLLAGRQRSSRRPTATAVRPTATPATSASASSTSPSRSMGSTACSTSERQA